jgi:signal transduction histidine kinase
MTSAADELELPAGRRAAVPPHAVPGLGSDRDAGEGDTTDRVPVIALLIARIIAAVVFTGFPAIAFLYGLIYRFSPPLVALSAVLLLATVTLQAFYFNRPGINLHSPLTYAALVVQALLIYLPLTLIYGEAWIGMPMMLAGTVLLVLPGAYGWALYAVTALSAGVIEYLFTKSVVNVFYAIDGVALFGLAVYGTSVLTGLITELHAARSELASTAVAHERLRFARDLHDLLGQSLTAIAPKGELARRLVYRNPERARHELAEVLDISRRALADVRAVAHGYRDLNLDEESRTAESVLAASRVEVRLERTHGDLPVRIRALLAAVLREGVANLLEHSDAERCDIIMRQRDDRVSLDIVNDGVDEALARSGAFEGSGLHTLAERVAGLGGQLTAGLDADGRYRLHLSVPVAKDEEHDGAAEPDERESHRSIKFGKLLVAAVFIGQAVLTGLHFPELTDEAFPVVATSGYLFLMLLIQLYFAAPTTRLRSPSSYALLASQAVLVYLPLLQFGLAWLALPGFLAGSALLVLRPAIAWPAFVAVAASAGWAQYSVTGMLVESLYSGVSAVIHGAVVYGLTWMVRSMAELRSTRVQLAKAAVADERLRFARDLHDLLGLSLSAITLKSELAHKLVTAAPDKAASELTEILAISRLALADVRLVASGYRDLSLDEEFRTAESLLAAAEVDVRLDMKVGELPDQVGTLLATVLREGVTNVLRHSKGERCEITVEQQNSVVYLDIVNDGVTQTPERKTNGSGISNLSYRVALVGGELTAGLEPDGRFRLRAKVPA